MEQNKSTSDDIPAWTLTRDEYKNTAQATQAPSDSVLGVNLQRETSETLKRFRIRELSAVAQIFGARRSGKKASIIGSILSRHRALTGLAAETVESLISQKVVELNARLRDAGLPASYGNKETKGRALIDWRDTLRAKAPDMRAQSKHVVAVESAMAGHKFHLAVASGEMTKERAFAIIKSAKLQPPADLSKVINAPVGETKRKGGRPTRALEDAEIMAMFRKIDGRYAQRTRAMLMCGIHMALRASELCGLLVGDVSDGHEVRHYITIRSEIAKGSKQRFVRIGGDVGGVIADFLKCKHASGESLSCNAALFVSQKGGHLSRKRLFVTVKEILQRAGIDQSPHCLRKTGATIYYQQSGYDLIATQVFLGHADPSVTRRYIGITPQQTVEYAQRASQHLVSAVDSKGRDTAGAKCCGWCLSFSLVWG